VYFLFGVAKKNNLFMNKKYFHDWRGKNCIFIAFDMGNNLQNKLKPSGISRSFVGEESSEE